jgi:squalene cyclase
MGLNQNVSFEGWCSSQLCVTAVAVNALIESGSSAGIGDAMDLIRRSQTADGYWDSYWWSGKLYATVHCMEALKKGGTGDDASLLSKAQDWVARTQLDDGSWGDSAIAEGVPFWTALALRGLMVEPRPDFSGRIARGIDWLLTYQMADGGWSPGYILRIPHPPMKEPWKEPSWKRDGKAIGALIRDHRRLFSTATAFTALSEFKEMMSRGRML